VNDPHWIEYVGAFGGLAGVALAMVAAWFAWKSGAEAKRTADAAERTASAAEDESRVSRELIEIQRAEHAAFIEERARAPQLTARCRVHLDLDVEGAAARRVILEIGWDNSGSKSLERAGFNLIVPDDVVIWLSDGHGNVSSLPSGWLMPAPLHELSKGKASHYLTRTVDAPLHQHTVMHVGLDIPVPGRYPLEYKIFQHELSGGGFRSVMLLTVSADRPATLTPLPTDLLPIVR
jgi:hypothetical protein